MAETSTICHEILDSWYYFTPPSHLCLGRERNHTVIKDPLWGLLVLPFVVAFVSASFFRVSIFLRFGHETWWSPVCPFIQYNQSSIKKQQNGAGSLLTSLRFAADCRVESPWGPSFFLFTKMNIDSYGRSFDFCPERNPSSTVASSSSSTIKISQAKYISNKISLHVVSSKESFLFSHYIKK